MTVATVSLTATIAEFIVKAAPPPRARERAAIAVCDTIGVALAGASEPAARIVRAADHVREPRQLPHPRHRPNAPSASDAAFANGVAAHALDFDDMCFVSMAHPSCALVPAALAAARAGRRLRARRARRVHRRLRARMPAGHRHEPAPLSRARMALHLVHRHARRRGRRRARPRACRRRRPLTRSASPRRSPAASRKTSGRW